MVPEAKFTPRLYSGRDWVNDPYAGKKYPDDLQFDLLMDEVDREYAGGQYDDLPGDEEP
jgi:hypothetical protein